MSSGCILKSWLLMPRSPPEALIPWIPWVSPVMNNEYHVYNMQINVTENCCMSNRCILNQGCWCPGVSPEALIPCWPHQSWYHVYNSRQLMLQFYWEMLHVKKWVYSHKMAADALESLGPCVPYKAEKCLILTRSIFQHGYTCHGPSGTSPAMKTMLLE